MIAKRTGRLRAMMIAATTDKESAALAIAECIGRSVKYRALCPATILDVVRKEIERSQNTEGAEDRARERLHRVAAFYLSKTNLKKLLKHLNNGASEGAEPVEALCERLLKDHASTAERMPHLSETYERLWEITGRPRRIMDLACAFHPFGLRWMKLDLREVEYAAFDNNHQIVECLNAYFRLEGLNGRAHWEDIVVNPPACEADAALFLKMYHCAENREAGSALKLLERINAPALVISLPLRSLGSRGRPVGEAYPGQIVDFAARQRRTVRELLTPDEHFFVLLQP